MTPAQERHLARFPSARASTLADIARREKTSALIEAEYEAWLHKQLLASLRTLPINAKRAYVAGRL